MSVADISSLFLSFQHTFSSFQQREERRRAREVSGVEGEDPQQTRIPVIETATGAIMSGMQAPTAATLEVFLASNPGWEVLPEEDTESSDEEEEKVVKEGKREEEGRRGAKLKSQCKSYFVFSHGCYF